MEDPVVASMTPEQVAKIRKENNDIDVQLTFEVKESEKDLEENRIPNPIQTFEQAFSVYIFKLYI